MFLFLRAHRERARDVLLGQRPVWKEAVAGLTLLPLVFMLALVVLAVLITVAPQLHNVQRNPMQDLMQNPRDAAIFGDRGDDRRRRARGDSARRSSCTGSSSTWAAA